MSTKYHLNSSSNWEFNEEGDPEDREWYIPYHRSFNTYEEALNKALTEKDLIDWEIRRVTVESTLVASSKEFNEV